MQSKSIQAKSVLAKPILVTGTTGKTGRRLALRLEQAGLSFRRAARSTPQPFDWMDATTWPGSLAGTGAVYLCFQPDYAFPGALDMLDRFVEQAKLEGIERIVMLTGRGERHAEQGEDIVRRSGLNTTVLRSAWFAQNFSEGSLRDAVLAGVVPMPGGDVREAIIDLEDLVDVAFAALTEPRHAGKIYELTGPELLGFSDVAAILSEAVGRHIEYHPITFEDFHGELQRSAGEQFADIVTAIDRETFDGRNAHVARGVERAIGRSPRSFKAFATNAAKSGAWTRSDAAAA